MVKSVIGDFVTGELWKAEISNKGYETRPEAVRAGERAVEEAIITALHDDLTKDVTLDDVQLQTFYDEHKQELITEPETRIAVIIAADDPGAKAIYDQLQAGANFADLAKTKSIDAASGQNGGELARPLYKEEIEQMPDLQQVLDTLKVGTYSAPMPVPVGFGPAGSMVVRLLERIEPRQMLFDEIKEPLHERALQLEQDKKFSDWLKARMDEYKVEIFPDALGVINFEDLKQQGA
jgi:parvulin-like peptidyl-prolyl isomerase